ncbi:amino acid-binding protein [Propionibacteriaceae bacterium Y1700]|uniref:amino acid-binding protein n=1 Tax=Microlunatus sp. Y1700 TaxID=3418487 RepID=UPI003DA79985
MRPDKMVAVFLMRVTLPDRPGSLGLVASAVGRAGADITSVQIVGRTDGAVIDDFTLTMPPDRMVDQVVSACHGLAGVHVDWISRYPEGGGVESDIEALEQMTNDPENGAATLAASAIRVFTVHWALLVQLGDEPATLFSTPNAPDLEADQIRELAPWGNAQARELPAGWLEGWGEVVVGVAPVRGNRAVIIGRQGGPIFLQSELARLGHLAALAT